MGNRAKRVEAARLLKERGLPTKLYRGHKLLAYRYLRHCREEIHKLQYGVGDIIHDCDARNHRITGYAYASRYPVRGHLFQKSIRNWTDGNVRGYVFEHPQYAFTSPSGERFSCGCPANPDPPVSREEYEKSWLDIDAAEEQYERPDGTTQYSKKDLVVVDGWSEFDDEIVAHLKAGGHIVDEEGLWLPEWEAKREARWQAEVAELQKGR